MSEEYLKSVIKYLQDEKNAIENRENKLIKKVIDQGKRIQELEAKVLNQRLTKILIDDSPAECKHIKTFCHCVHRPLSVIAQFRKRQTSFLSILNLIT